MTVLKQANMRGRKLGLSVGLGAMAAVGALTGGVAILGSKHGQGSQTSSSMENKGGLIQNTETDDGQLVTESGVEQSSDGLKQIMLASTPIGKMSLLMVPIPLGDLPLSDFYEKIDDTTRRIRFLAGMESLMKLPPAKFPHSFEMVSFDSGYVTGRLVGQTSTETEPPTKIDRISPLFRDCSEKAKEEALFEIAGYTILFQKILHYFARKTFYSEMTSLVGSYDTDMKVNVAYSLSDKMEEFTRDSIAPGFLKEGSELRAFDLYDLMTYTDRILAEVTDESISEEAQNDVLEGLNDIREESEYIRNVSSSAIAKVPRESYFIYIGVGKSLRQKFEQMHEQRKALIEDLCKKYPDEQPFDPTEEECKELIAKDRVIVATFHQQAEAMQSSDAE